MASSFSRSWRLSTGAEPALEMATISGERSMMAGMMALQWAGESTTLQKIWRRFASLKTCWLTSGWLVAAITSHLPSSSSG